MFQSEKHHRVEKTKTFSPLAKPVQQLLIQWYSSQLWFFFIVLQIFILDGFYPIFCIVWFSSSFLHFFSAAVSFLWVIFHTLIFNHGFMAEKRVIIIISNVSKFIRFALLHFRVWLDVFDTRTYFNIAIIWFFIEIEHFLWYYLVWCGKIDIFMLPLTSLCGTGEENARMVCRWREWSDFFLLTKYKYLKTSPSQRSTLEQNAYPS